jgi:hypothetical protein
MLSKESKMPVPAWAKDFKLSPYGAIQYTTCTGDPSGFIVCKGDLRVSTGKFFTNRGDAVRYARKLIDDGWTGDITIRFTYD